MKRSIISLLFAALLSVAIGGYSWDKVSAAAEVPNSKSPDLTAARADALFVKLADQVYAAANAGNRQLAYSMVNRLEQAAAKPEIRNIGNLPGWEAFDRSLRDARQALSDDKGNAAYLQAARLKLAADALFRKAPLWLQYREVLKNDLVRMRQAWSAQGIDRPAAALANLNVLQLHSKRIEVAALMGRPQEQVRAFYDQIERTERILAFASSHKEHKRLVEGAFIALDQTVEALFVTNAAVAEAPLPAMLPQTIRDARRGKEQLATMYISAFVLGVLGYAGWRRYRFDQNHGAAYPPTGFSDEARRR
ncbi:sporulation protein YpjB [Paenibacillus mendelii]|uniref:Sporulation protein YpjB n=1 Tax=Paenibacillus mendelii TaxID=206163 RepID=A0ABV6JGT4_9BACL|nr:sporulation protein YpjB [Paenibacillus mendelii]MCQ6558008.1 sporulation protein YpjB [Paenibacillus mendelii]